MVMVMVGVMHAVSPTGSAQPSVPPVGWLADAALLKDPAARVGAARRLLATTDADARRYVLDALQSTSTPNEERDVLLQALASGAPLGQNVDWTFPALSTGLKNGVNERRPERLASLSAVHTRESLRLILSYTDASQPPAIRDAAFAAAVRLCGKYQFGNDAKQWQEWFAGVEWLPEPEWQRILAESATQYALQLETQRDAVLRRLVESERRRFIEAPDAERWAILCSQLSDELPSLRRLGVELTNRELANARIPPERVWGPVLALLKDPVPDLRATGASLVERLQPTGAEGVIAEAILKERDPAVMVPLLRLASRSTSPELRAKLLDWLDPSSATFGDVVRAIDAMEKNGLLTKEEDRVRVLAALRAVPPEAAEPAMLRLRAALGSEADREEISKLLGHPDAAKRLAAAQALAAFPEWVDAVLVAAKTDDSLVPVACDLVVKLHPNVPGFERLLRLAESSPASAEVRRPILAALIAVGEKIRPSELLVSATDITDPELRETVLSRFATLPIGPVSIPVVRVDHAQSLIAAVGLLRLAETRLELHKPAAALTAIERIEESRVPVSPSLLVSLKAQALLGMNRIADAIEVDAPPSSWIAALRGIADLPHAPAVLRVMEANFAGQFSPEEREAVASLRGEIAGKHPSGATTSDNSRPRSGGPRIPGR